MNSDIRKNFITGCMTGNLDMINKIIKSNNNNNNANIYYNKGLVLACEMGHLNIVNRLIELGADVNYTHDSYIYANGFVNACRYGYTHIVDRLMEFNIKKIFYNLGFNFACRLGNLYLVNKLVKYSTDLNKNFIEACIYGALNIVDRLMELSPNLDLNNGFKNACILGNLKIINRLIWLNVDIHMEDDMIFKFLYENKNFNINKVLIGFYFDNYKIKPFDVNYDIFENILNRISMYYNKIINDDDEYKRLKWIKKNKYNLYNIV